jgi:hypothetical protein
MLRDIEGQQFSDAVKEKLGPRVAIMGERQHSTAQHDTAQHCTLLAAAAKCLWNTADTVSTYGYA